MSQASQAPSLIGADNIPPLHARVDAAENPQSLLDLMLHGFYMILLLRNRYAPADADTFRARVREYLDGVDKGGRRLGLATGDVHLAKYAFAALVDETVLTSSSSIRPAWERKPLQLELFGDQLAGEHFFDRLEELRREGVAKVQVLEVFHMALLMGLQGKYRIEGPEKLGFLTARLGDEIAHLRGARPGFAPHGLANDSVRHKLRHEVPLWVMASAFALAGLLAFIGLRWSLAHQTDADLLGYQAIVKMPEQPAYVTITLP
jgi:type VI secretion system protein ImpK